MLICTIYIEETNPCSDEMSDESTELIKLMGEIKPYFETKIKFAYTGSPDAMSRRHTIGIDWEDLPAIGINAAPSFRPPFPRDYEFTKEDLIQWLNEVTSEKYVEADAQQSQPPTPPPSPSSEKPDPKPKPTEVMDEL